jgi:hypothetical protein
MRRCCVHHIAGYPPCGKPSVEMVTIEVASGTLDIDLCQECLDHLKRGIQETGRIPEHPEKVERSTT